MTTLLSIAVALAGGLFMTRILKRLNMPDVTAFLIAGLLIGPVFIGRLGIEGIGFSSYEEIEKLSAFNDVALGFIAFSIGNEFRVEDLKKIGKQATIVGFCEAGIASIIVDIVLISFHFIAPDVLSLPVAITLGAVAAATAPAATLMVVRQYKASGDVTKILLPVVALDDAIGLMIFSFSIGFAKALKIGTANIAEIILQPIIEIILSLIIGAICGFILTKAEAHFHSGTNRNSLIVSFVILTVAVAKAVIVVGNFSCGFSALLVCMMMGVVFCNTCPLSSEMMRRSDIWTSPLLMLFFVLSGAELHLSVFKNYHVVLVGITYIITRSIGKYTGARIGSTISGCSKTIRKYLGLTLIPQAGVALGMSIVAINQLGPDDGGMVRNITLFGVMIYELVGPTITKWALTQAGDIKPQPDHIKHRRKNAIESGNNSIQDF